MPKILCLADAHGIKGFEIPEDQMLFAKLRARHEQENYATLFKVELGQKMRSSIRNLLNEGKRKEALTLLKSHVKEKRKKIFLPKDLEDLFMENYRKIPDESLNPFTE
jgi:hypothetical protein